MESRLESNVTVWPFPFSEQDWEQTPPAVQAYLHTLRHEMGQLQERVESLEARLNQNSATSSRPPSSDSPYKKRNRSASENLTLAIPPSYGVPCPHGNTPLILTGPLGTDAARSARLYWNA